MYKRQEVGYGWGTLKNPKEAIKEAIDHAKINFKDGVEYVILFSTVDYNLTKIIKELKNEFPNAQIYGGTSMLAVITRDGYHTSKNGSLALLIVSSEKVKFGVGGADIEKYGAREAGKEAIKEAIKNANKKKEIPQVILMTAAPGKEEEIIEGIEEIIGKNVPIIGGSSGDNDLSGKWKQVANERVYSNGVSLTAVYTDLDIGIAYEAGYLRSESKGKITNATGRVIYEINNMPAAEVYNRWTNGIINQKLEEGGTILSETTFFPLAKILYGNTTIHYLSIHPLSVNLPEKSLTVFANVKKDDDILLMHGNWELLLNRAQSTPRKALISKNIPKEKIAFGIYTFCAGTMLAIPEKERPKMPLLIKSVLGDVPFIGTFTFGEQGFLTEIGNRHGNLANSMVVFSNE